jgi:hypothetical protein
VKSAPAVFVTLTVSANDDDVLFSPSPPYDAVIVCEPALSDDVDSDACALPSSPVFPIFEEPSKKVTDPAGVSAPPVTVAVNVTGEPWPTAFADDVSDVDEPTFATFNVFDADVLAELLLS